MISDSWFNHAALTAINQHKGPAFAYLFAHQGDYSISYMITNSTFKYGMASKFTTLINYY